jgi:hypothetical protein
MSLTACSKRQQASKTEYSKTSRRLQPCAHSAQGCNCLDLASLFRLLYTSVHTCLTLSR